MLQNQTAAIGQSRGPSTDMRTPSQTIKPAVRAEGTRDRQGMKDGDCDRYAVKAWRQLKRKSKRGETWGKKIISGLHLLLPAPLRQEHLLRKASVNMTMWWTEQTADGQAVQKLQNYCKIPSS